MNIKHEILIYWSDGDKCFIAEVPELQGCMAHGGTYKDALESIESASKLWIKTAKEISREVPEPKGRLYYA